MVDEEGLQRICTINCHEALPFKFVIFSYHIVRTVYGSEMDCSMEDVLVMKTKTRGCVSAARIDHGLVCHRAVSPPSRKQRSAYACTLTRCMTTDEEQSVRQYGACLLLSVP